MKTNSSASQHVVVALLLLLIGFSMKCKFCIHLNICKLAVCSNSVAIITSTYINIYIAFFPFFNYSYFRTYFIQSV